MKVEELGRRFVPGNNVFGDESIIRKHEYSNT